MFLRNLNTVARSLLRGERLQGLGGLYDPRYPPSKFITWHRDKKRLKIECIFSGFPRSGTNWIRRVLEDSTGFKTGKVLSREHKEFAKGENYDRFRFVKIHARNKYLARLRAVWLLPPHEFSGKYIYCYRDPRDAILSLYEMYIQRKSLSSLSIDEFIRKYDPIGQFRWEAKSWVLRRPKGVLAVKYEDLKENPYAEFQRIFSFLGVQGEVADRSLNRQVNQGGKETGRPRATPYGWKQAPRRYEHAIRTISDRLAEEISALGYQALPDNWSLSNGGTTDKLGSGD